MKLQLTFLAAAVAMGTIAPVVVAFPQRAPSATNYYERVGIRLTGAQKTKIAAIEADALAQIDRVYTSEQRATISSARQTMGAIGLSTEQRRRLKKFSSDPSQDFRSILTAQQQQQLRQNHRDKRVGRQFNHLGGPVAMLKAQGLVLSADQESQLTALHQQRKAEIDRLYSPAQRARLEAARQQLAGVQLTEAQNTQIDQIRRQAWIAKEAVLTPEQLRQLPQNQP
jgi:hypothetical protein